MAATTDSKIRPMTLTDITEVSHLHCRAFPGFFLSTLGPAVLREYYRAVIEYPQSCTLLATRFDVIQGFVVGFANPASFYSHLRHRGLAFLWPTAQQVMRTPSILYPIAQRLKALIRNRQAPTQGGLTLYGSNASHSWELASLAVDPHAQRTGLGRRLVMTFIDDVRLKAATRVLLNTDAVDNDRTNQFYEQLGFERCACRQTTKGRIMNTYAYHIQKAA